MTTYVNGFGYSWTFNVTQKQEKSYTINNWSAFQLDYHPNNSISFNTISLWLKKPSDINLYDNSATFTVRVWRIASAGDGTSYVDAPVFYGGNLNNSPVDRNVPFRIIDFLGEASIPVSSINSTFSQYDLSFSSLITSLPQQPADNGYPVYFGLEIRCESRNITFGVQETQGNSSIWAYNNQNNSSIGSSSASNIYYGLSTAVVNTAPTSIYLSNNTLAENSPAGTVIGTFSSIDAENNVVSYAIVGGGDGISDLMIDSDGITLKVAPGASIDYEMRPQYNIIVEATDAGGLTYQEQLFIWVTDQQEPNANSFVFTESYLTNLNASFADLNKNHIEQIVIQTTDNGAPYGAYFNGNVIFNTNVIGNMSWIKYQGQIYNLASWDFNHPNDPRGFDVTLNGELRQKFSGSYQDTWISTTSEGYGSLNPNEISIKFGHSGQFDTLVQMRITGSARNAVFYTQPVVAAIGPAPANYAPIDIQISNQQIAENASGYDLIGYLSAVDSENNVVSFNITGGQDASLFQITNTNQLRLANNASLDFETATEHYVEITATDAGGLTYTRSFTVYVLDVAEPIILQNPTLVDGKAVMNIAVNPTITPVRVVINGVEQSLPDGSVVKNISTGQKFLKIPGGDLSFDEIAITPPIEWSWDVAGITAWSVLQQL